MLKNRHSNFKDLTFCASEYIMTKFKSQALHIIKSGSGSPSFLISDLWNIAIYVLKTKFYVPFCTQLQDRFLECKIDYSIFLLFSKG